jgi:hypothetical protein
MRIFAAQPSGAWRNWPDGTLTAPSRPQRLRVSGRLSWIASTSELAGQGRLSRPSNMEGRSLALLPLAGSEGETDGEPRRRLGRPSRAIRSGSAVGEDCVPCSPSSRDRLRGAAGVGVNMPYWTADCDCRSQPAFRSPHPKPVRLAVSVGWCPFVLGGVSRDAANLPPLFRRTSWFDPFDC